MRWFGHVLRRDTVRILYIQTKGVKDLTARRDEKVRLSRGFMDVVMKDIKMVGVTEEEEEEADEFLKGTAEEEKKNHLTQLLL